MKQKRLVFHFKALKKTYFAFTLVQLLNSDQEKNSFKKIFFLKVIQDLQANIARYAIFEGC